jgi:hypothetical protein
MRDRNNAAAVRVVQGNFAVDHRISACARLGFNSGGVIEIRRRREPQLPNEHTCHRLVFPDGAFVFLVTTLLVNLGRLPKPNARRRVRTSLRCSERRMLVRFRVLSDHRSTLTSSVVASFDAGTFLVTAMALR